MHVIVNNTHTQARRVSHVSLPVWIFLRPYDVGAKLKLDKNMNSTLWKWQIQTYHTTSSFGVQQSQFTNLPFILENLKRSSITHLIISWGLASFTFLGETNFVFCNGMLSWPYFFCAESFWSQGRVCMIKWRRKSWGIKHNLPNLTQNYRKGVKILKIRCSGSQPQTPFCRESWKSFGGPRLLSGGTLRYIVCHFLNCTSSVPLLKCRSRYSSYPANVRVSLGFLQTARFHWLHVPVYHHAML